MRLQSLGEDFQRNMYAITVDHRIHIVQQHPVDVLVVQQMMLLQDVIILDAGQDKLPTKSEKVDLEKDGRIASGFDIDRKWNSTDLQLHLASLLTG